MSETGLYAGEKEIERQKEQAAAERISARLSARQEVPRPQLTGGLSDILPGGLTTYYTRRAVEATPGVRQLQHGEEMGIIGPLEKGGETIAELPERVEFFRKHPELAASLGMIPSIAAGAVPTPMWLDPANIAILATLGTLGAARTSIRGKAPTEAPAPQGGANRGPEALGTQSGGPGGVGTAGKMGTPPVEEANVTGTPAGGAEPPDTKTVIQERFNAPPAAATPKPTKAPRPTAAQLEGIQSTTEQGGDVRAMIQGQIERLEQQMDTLGAQLGRGLKDAAQKREIAYQNSSLAKLKEYASGDTTIRIPEKGTPEFEEYQRLMDDPSAKKELRGVFSKRKGINMNVALPEALEEGADYSDLIDRLKEEMKIGIGSSMDKESLGNFARRNIAPYHETEMELERTKQNLWDARGILQNIQENLEKRETTEAPPSGLGRVEKEPPLTEAGKLYHERYLESRGKGTPEIPPGTKGGAPLPLGPQSKTMRPEYRAEMKEGAARDQRISTIENHFRRDKELPVDERTSPEDRAILEMERDKLLRKTPWMTETGHVASMGEIPERTLEKFGLGVYVKAISEGDRKMQLEKVGPVVNEMSRILKSVGSAPQNRWRGLPPSPESEALSYLAQDLPVPKDGQYYPGLAERVKNKLPILQQAAEQMKPYIHYWGEKGGLPPERFLPGYMKHVVKPEEDPHLELFDPQWMGAPLPEERGVISGSLEYHRTGAPDYEHDFSFAMQRYVHEVLRKIYLDEPAREMSAAAGQLHIKSSVAKYALNKVLGRTLGEPEEMENMIGESIQKGVIASSQRIRSIGMFGYGEKIADQMQAWSQLPVASQFRRVLNGMKNITAMPNIALNPLAWLRIVVGGGFDVFARFKPGDFVSGVKDAMLSATPTRVGRLLDEGFNKTGLRVLNQMGPVFDQEIRDITKFGDESTKWIWAMTRTAELGPKKLAYFSGRQEWLGDHPGDEGQNALDAGFRGVQDTQPIFSKPETPLVLSNPAMRGMVQYSQHRLVRLSLYQRLLRPYFTGETKWQTWKDDPSGLARLAIATTINGTLDHPFYVGSATLVGKALIAAYGGGQRRRR